MNLDTAAIAAQINELWSRYGGWIITGVAAVTVALVLAAVLVLWRSRHRARLLSGLTALVVLAWTSEGLWEVARHTLGLPAAFAAMTFFVFEAMMLSSAMQAEQHRARYGTPGPAGRYVWVLAAITATVVGLNAASAVEAVLRVALPLAAAGLWWVGMLAPRDSDTEGIRAERERAAQRRAATWAVTPRTILVAIGLMRPGEETVTDAERERRIRRMVAAADRVHASPDTWLAHRAATRLRRLARLANAEDIAEVRQRVGRAAGVVQLVVPTTGTPKLNKGRSADRTPRWTRPPSPTPGHEAVSTRAGDDRAASTPGERVPPGQASVPGQADPGDGYPGTRVAASPTPGVGRSPARRTRSGRNLAREEAERVYRDSVAAGEPLSGGQLAARFGCDESTARRWIRAWRAAEPTFNGHQPAETASQ